MRVFRICREEYSLELVASGRMNRWNKDGQHVIYAAEYRALCALELLAHTNGVVPAGNYRTMVIEIPETKIEEINWKPDLIIASYHGIPKKYFDKGDPYHCYCHKTSRLIKEKFNKDIPILTTFQSRFGPQEWLQPYTDKTFEKLPKDEGVAPFVSSTKRMPPNPPRIEQII